MAELHRVLQQRVGADHDAGLRRAATSSRTCRFCAADIEPVSSATRVASSGATELTGHRQRAQDVADGPRMLGGKDFRRREQRALIAGVDHLQHGQHRDDGLARADLSLQQPVHRPGGRQFGGDDAEDVALDRWSTRTEAAPLSAAARPSAAGAAGPDSENSEWRRCTSAHCMPIASSKVSRWRARSRSASRSAR